jgi:hypothetical protein
VYRPLPAAAVAPAVAPAVEEATRAFTSGGVVKDKMAILAVGVLGRSTEE